PFPCSRGSLARVSPARRKLSGPMWAADFDRIAAKLRRGWIIPRQCRGADFAAKKRLPAFLVSGGDALVGGALCGLADRAGDGNAAEQLLLGADLAQPFVVRGRQRLPGREACAGFGQLDLGGLVGVIGPLFVR